MEHFIKQNGLNQAIMDAECYFRFLPFFVKVKLLFRFLSGGKNRY